MNRPAPSPRASALFLAMATIPAADRETWLADQCGGDVELRREIDSLIAALEAPDAFLDPERLHPPALDADLPLPAGTRLGDFTVQRPLASGSSGVVYAALQDRPRRVVALKVLRRGLAATSAQRRFEIEAELLGQLQHAGIAQIFAAHPGNESIPPFIAMEMIDGPPITDFASRGGLSVRARVELLAGVCDAVQHAHGRGVVHRDLKPGNVLIGGDGQPKIVDFGVARANSAALALTMVDTVAGELVGTVPYMSPEQVRGASGDVDAASDIYALGVILFRLLTGRLPFADGEPSLPELARRIAEDEPPRIAQLDPELPPALDAIVARALAKDRADRYASAADFAADLRRWLAGEATAASAAPRSQPDGFRRRRMIAAGAVASVAALVAGWAWMARPAPDARRTAAPAGKIMLAVLPLENLTGSDDLQLFVDGLHEEILSRLGRLHPSRIGVIARTSTLQYRGTRKSIDRIGQELGVDYVLEGSVRRADRRLRITGQLIQAADQTHLWAETFERELDDLFSVQTVIAARIADALAVDVLPHALASAGPGGLLAPDAQAALMRGKHFWHRRSHDFPANVHQAEQYFRQVIAMAPNHAEAHSSLAEINTYLAMYGPDGERISRREQARASISRSLALAPRLPSALLSLASLRMEEWDWSGAETAFRQGLQEAPNDAEGHSSFATLLSWTGRYPEANTEMQLAQQLDPLNLAVHANAFYVHLGGRRFDRAEHAATAFVELVPQPTSQARLELLLALRGDCTGALARLADAQRLLAEPDATASGHVTAFVIGRCGRPDTLVQWTQRMERQEQAYAFTLAAMHAGAGNRERALRWLEESIRRHEGGAPLAVVDPRLDSLRSDPRFQRLIAQLGLQAR